jgi:hypothetical protein
MQPSHSYTRRTPTRVRPMSPVAILVMLFLLAATVVASANSVDVTAAVLPGWIGAVWDDLVVPQLPATPALTLLEQNDSKRYWARVLVIVVGYMSESNGPRASPMAHPAGCSHVHRPRGGL